VVVVGTVVTAAAGAITAAEVGAVVGAEVVGDVVVVVAEGVGHPSDATFGPGAPNAACQP
jgi:hypothetical protein